MLGANLQPAENVVLRFRAQALLLIRQKTGDRCSCRVSWSIGEHNIDLIAQLQILHLLIPFDNSVLSCFGQRSLPFSQSVNRDIHDLPSRFMAPLRFISTATENTHALPKQSVSISDRYLARI